MDERETKLEPQLASALRELSEDGLKPPRDLWPGLERRIVSSPRPRRPLWTYAAAAVVLVGSVAGLVWLLGGRPAATGFRALAASRSAVQLPVASSIELRETFARYLAERERILGLVAERLRDYPPAVRDEIRDSIEVIEREMRQIEQSLGTIAPDPATEARLAALYELELRLIGVVSERLRGGGA